MPLMPKRVKYRKSQRGKIRGQANRGNTVAYGDFGLQVLTSGWITGRQIEAGRGRGDSLFAPRGQGLYSDLPAQAGIGQAAGDADGQRQR